MTKTIEAKYVAFIGDPHGDWQHLLNVTREYRDTCFIICGDCGFGFHDTKEPKIKSMIKKMHQPFLEKRNNWFVFLRGNHDDPLWFYDEELMRRINTDRFILVRDFTLVEVAGKRILCIGGAVSIDRRFRKTNSSYWMKEEVGFILTTLSENVNELINIDILCTHTVPRNYVQNNMVRKDWIRESFKVDKKLAQDCDREDRFMENMYKNFTPKVWFHGHYHFSADRMINDSCRLISLNEKELFQIKDKEYYDTLQIDTKEGRPS